MADGDKGARAQGDPVARGTERHLHKDTKGWLKTLLGYTSRCRGRMVLAGLLSIASVFVGLVPYYATYRVIDMVATAPADRDVPWSVVLAWVALAALAHVVRYLFFAIATINSHICAYSILAELRLGIAGRLMDASLGTARARSVGHLKNVVADRIEQIELPLAHMIPELSANLLLAVSIAAWLVAIDWRLALSCLATLPIGLAILGVGSRGYYRMYGGYLSRQDQVNSVVVEYIEGIRVVKAFNQTTSSYQRFANAVTDFLDYTLRWMRTARPALALSMSVLPTTLLGVVPAGVTLFSGGFLTAGEFGLACMLALAIVTPAVYMGASLNEMNLIAYSIADAQEFLSLPTLDQPATLADVCGYDVRLDKLSFSYDGQTEVLHDLSLRLPEGSFTALVGPSGSGKSTIARLIVRHWDVCAGSVSIGGVDVRAMPLNQLSCLVSYVSQDDYLLDGTLLDNLRMGKPDASEDELRVAAEAASCEEFVSRLPRGWDTPAGEAGRALSGGERQRICIARAILKDAPIIILDEATAFADPENEAHIQRSVARLARKKTLIVIAHRLSTITAADTICVMDKGRIVARGTHESLLEGCQLYADMWMAHVGAAGWAAGSHAPVTSEDLGGGAR